MLLLLVQFLLVLRSSISSRETLISERELLQQLLLESITSCPLTDFNNPGPCTSDETCYEYGDCCPSKILDYMQNSTDLVNPLPPKDYRWQCRRLKMIPNRDMVFMVSSCPDQWQDLQVTLRCTKNVKPRSYTHILDVPVFSENTKVLYSNVYCAVCNNDSSKIAPTALTITCDQWTGKCLTLLPSARYVPGELRWEADYVKIEAFVKDISPTRRRCRDYIEGCDWQNSSLSTMEEEAYRKLCYAYSYPIRIITTTRTDVYKNIHCAVCRGQLYNSSSCTHFNQTPLFESHAGFGVSFSLLMDFQGGGNVGERSACGPGKMYDSLKKACITYSCGRLYKMDKLGECVPKKISSFVATYKKEHGLMDSCAKIVVPQSDFWYVNESVIGVNRTNGGKVYETSSFEKAGNGSVLICVPDTVVSSARKFSKTQGVVSSVCIIFSLVCLAVHIAAHALLAKLRNLPGKNLLSLSCSIFLGQLLFLTGINLKEPRVACVVIAATMHLSYLASFFWMNVMAFDMFRTFSSKYFRPNYQQSRRFAYYSTYAWTLPFVIVTVALVLDATDQIPQLKPRYADPYCWINTRLSLAIFLALPLLVVLVENVIFFTMTALAIRKATADAAFATRGSTASTERARFFLYLKLTSIVGLTWIFGFIAALTNLETFWYLNIILNSLQGAFIFFAFTFKRKTLSMMMEKLPKNFLTPRAKQAAEPSRTTQFTSAHTE